MPDPQTVARWALGLDGRDAARCRAALEAHAGLIHRSAVETVDDPPRGAAWLAGVEALAMQAGHDHYFALVDRAREAFAGYPHLAAWAVMRRGRMAFLKGHYGRAMADARWAEAQLDGAADSPPADGRWPPTAHEVLAAARLLRSAVARNSGDPRRALDIARAEAGAAEARGARWTALNARFQMACALHVLGQRPDAEAAYRALFGELAALGAERLRALVLGNLAIAARDRGETAAARAWQAEAGALLDRLGDRLMRTKVDALVGDAPPRDRIDAVGDEESRLVAELARARALGESGDGARAAVILDQIRWTAEGLELGWITDAAADARAALDDALHIDPDGFTTPGAPRVDLGRYGAPRLILRRLAEARIADEGPLTAEALVAAGWPGERMRADSGLTRVYTAVRTLRRLGLADRLQTTPDGYRLDGPMRWCPGSNGGGHRRGGHGALVTVGGDSTGAR